MPDSNYNYSGINSKNQNVETALKLKANPSEKEKATNKTGSGGEGLKEFYHYGFLLILLVLPAEDSKAGTAAPVLSWSKYDFVPGDQVIFEDNLENEENGEFPSRWDLVQGNAEVAEFGGEKAIMMRDGHPSIVPYFKDPEEDYLPDVFTVELDIYYPVSGSFEIHLYDRKNQESGSSTGYTDVQINYGNKLQFAAASSNYPGKEDYRKGWGESKPISGNDNPEGMANNRRVEFVKM